MTAPRIRLDDMTDDQLDALYERLERRTRALDLAFALAEEFAARPTIRGEDAAQELGDVLDTALAYPSEPAPRRRLAIAPTPTTTKEETDRA